jgi:alanine-glyoxylate transaminase / serine-glyoxylate transaminase / serine-pyruvate transaminase
MKDRKLLMIPGPIEFEPAVLEAISQPTLSHVDSGFITSFGNALRMMREVWMCPSGQPFVIAGSGTLAMDMAGANLIEPGDRALVLVTGYFGLRYAELLKRYGAEVTVLEATLGETVPLEDIERELAYGRYKLMTFTHVDTSTGVLVDPRPLAEMAQRHGVLSILDGVCSIAGEEMRQEEWGIDVAVTASQKAIGVPPGLALLVASPRAMEVWKKRTTPVVNYFCDWGLWLPIMQAYEEGRPSYFATPAVNLVQGLEVSLRLMLEEGMNARFLRHREMAERFREAMRSLGLSFIPKEDKVMGHTLSAPYYPDGVTGPQLLPAVSANGVVVAGGLLPVIKDSYFRIGHMGMVNEQHINLTVSAISNGLKTVTA